MVVLAVIVLLFQAILLAHGGLTTLGANVVSMGIVGPFVSYGIYIGLKKMGVNKNLSIFLAAALGDLATYIMTSIQLALAHPAETGGVYVSLLKFMAIFAVTQVPIAVAEGLLTVLIMNLLISYSHEEMASLNIISGGNRNI
jgi:cobalt/nickel transport system permease protein